MQCLTIVGKEGNNILSMDFAKNIASQVNCINWRWLKNGVALDLLDVQTTRAEVEEIIAKLPLDYCLQPQADRLKKLLISDMDSTIIQQECIDEIADMIGVKAQVSEITERSMRGELDFSASLIKRVGLLKGLPVKALEEVWLERITIQKGAAELIDTMNKAGAFTMLVSGGFTFYTQKIAAKLGFQSHHANELIIENGLLTGEVAQPILHKAAKRDLLLQECEQRQIKLSETIAVGDGANDADMIMAAGLGVAYYAKPKLIELADSSINYTDLTSLLYFQGLAEQVSGAMSSSKEVLFHSKTGEKMHE
jgi:phosphoserine phosphatase